MKNLKKVLVVFLALVAIAAFTACGSSGSGDAGSGGGDAAASVELRCGTHYNTEHANYKLLEQFAESVKEKTDGAVTITLFPSSQLGDYSTMYGDLKSGALDMAMMSIASEYDPQFEMNFIPYAAGTYEEAEKYLGPDGYFFSEYKQIHAAQNVQLLGIYAEGMIGYGFTKEPANYNDPEAKKPMKIRSPAIEVYADVTKDLGFNSTTINYSDLYSAMQTGVCDGWVGGSPQLNWTDFKDVIKYYVPYNVFMENGGLFMSDAAWKKLSEDQQAVITECAAQLVADSFAQAEANDEDCLKKLEEYGVKILPLTDEELNAFKEKVRKDVWPTLYDKFGEDRLNKIMEDVEG